eukprot:scaffold299_cov343-Prasinococcus_capsulatus_cf.AAC.4
MHIAWPWACIQSTDSSYRLQQDTTLMASTRARSVGVHVEASAGEASARASRTDRSRVGRKTGGGSATLGCPSCADRLASARVLACFRTPPCALRCYRHLVCENATDRVRAASYTVSMVLMA